MNPQELKSIADVIGKTMRNAFKEHEARLGELLGGNDSGKRRKKDDSPTASKNANQRLTGSIRNLNKHVSESSSLFNELNVQLKRNLQNEKKRNQDDSKRDRRIKEQLELFRRTNDGVKQLNDSFQTMSVTTSSRSKTEGDAEETTRSFTDRLKDAGNQLAKTFSISAGLGKLLSDAQKAAATGGILNLETYTDSIVMAMDPQDLLDLQARFRTDALKVSGGLQQYTDELRNSQYDLIGYTSNLTEAAQASAAIRSSIMSVGTSFEEASSIIGSGSNGIVGQLKQMSAVTGQTIMELNEGMRSLINNDESRVLLEKMTSEQRLDYLATQARLRTQLTAMTGSVEKADEMLRAQQRDGSKTFLERFRAGALQSAAATRAGMSAENAARLRDLTVRNPTSLSETERTELMSLRGQLAETVRNMEGSSNVPTEFVGNVLSSQLLVDQLQDFNTELTKGLNPDAVAGQISNSVGALVDGEPGMKELIDISASIMNLQKNALPLIAGGVAIIAAKSAAGFIGRRMTPGFGRAQQRQRNLNRQNRASRPNMVDRMNFGARNPGMLGGALRVAGWGGREGGNVTGPAATRGAGSMTKLAKFSLGGIAAAGAGMLIDSFWTPETQDGEIAKNTGMNALSGAGLGATIGSFIAPGIGTAVGAALGGVVGGIYGYMQDTQTDQQRAAQNARQIEVDAERQLLQAQMSNEQVQHQQNIANLQEELRQADEGNRNVIEDRIRDAQIEHTARMEQLRSQQTAIEELNNSFSAYSNALDQQANFNDAFNDAFEKDWNLMSSDRRQVDMGELATALDMDSNALVTDIATVLLPSTNVTAEQMTRMREIIENGGEIEAKSNPELYALMEEYRRLKTESNRSDVTDGRTQLDESRQNALLAEEASKISQLSQLASTTIIDPSRSNVSDAVTQLINEQQNAGDGVTMRQILERIEVDRTQADTDNDGTVSMVEKLDLILQQLMDANNAARQREQNRNQSRANESTIAQTQRRVEMPYWATMTRV